MALESIIETAVLYVFLQKALAGLKRINLEGLRWRVFDAKGQVGSVFFSDMLFQDIIDLLCFRIFL
jgi:hypothetical protein